MMDIEVLIFMFSLPLLVFAFYLLLAESDDGQSIWSMFHSLMKSGRINKIVKMMGLKKSK